MDLSGSYMSIDNKSGWQGNILITTCDNILFEDQIWRCSRRIA